MARLAACPKCRNQFSLPELTGPATIACPFCGAHINIKVKGMAPPVAQPPPPAMMVQPAMAVARAMPVDDDEDDDDEEEERPRKKKKKKKGAKAVQSGSNEVGMKIAIVGGILLLTLLSIVFAFWWFLKGDSRPNIIIPTNTAPFSGVNRNLDEDDLAEATGTEKFEIADKALVHQELLTTFNPQTNLPGLQKDSVKENGDTLADAVLNRVKQATVYIETEAEDGGGTGSGFFACEKGLVITNAHVISMLEEGAEKPKSVRVYLNHGKSNQQDHKVIEIVKVDRKNDLAILRLPRASLSTYPEPLQLASSLTTRETQKVFSLGFPFGNSTGKEVTVTPIAVSSLRYQNGRINTVQFAGALNPGNSGGPIVDITGRVIGVAVRIMTDRSDGTTISNTGISFGVPCDEVAALYHGRPDRLDLYPPTRKGSSLQLPVMLRMTEHSSRKASPKIKITSGEEKTPPKNPANGDDASALKLSADAKQVYTGSIELPELEAGKVYWIQPQVTFGDNDQNWLEPLVYKPGRILDDKPLPSSTAGGASLGELKLQQRYDWNVHTSRGSYTTRVDYASTTAGEKSALKDLRVGAKYDDHSIAHQSLQRMWINRIPEEESYAQNQNGVKLTSALKENLNQWHDLAQLNIPKETVELGKSWKVAARTVMLDYLFGYDPNQLCTLNCEYIGSFTEGSRTIGVLRLQGSMADASSPNTPFGKVTGLALIDGASRQMLDFMLRCDARKRTTSGNSRVGSSPSIDGVMQLRLQKKDS